MAATMNEIATRAGVTKVTLYRHVRSKDELVLAVMADHYDRLRERADELGRSSPSPCEAITAYLEAAVLQLGPDRSYFHVAMMVGGVNEVIERSARALDAAVTRLLARARQERGIRDDVVAGDLHSLVLGLASTYTDGDDPQWRRTLRLVLDGLRPSPGPLGEPPMRLDDYARFQAIRAERRASRAEAGHHDGDEPAP